MNEVHVLMKDGFSYFKIDLICSTNAVCFVNGEQTESCVSDKSWKKFKGKINSIKIEYDLPQKVLEYRIKDEYKPLSKENSKFPFTKLIDSYDYDLDNNFYNAVYSPKERKQEEVPFIVIDKNCEPIQMVPGVKIQFPHNLNNHPETWHKYPCSISSHFVFLDLFNKAKEFCSKYSKYKIEDMINIGIFRVKEYIEVNFKKLDIRSYYRSLKAKKMTDEIYEVERIEIELLNIYSEIYTSPPKNVKIVPSFKADNYEQLKKKIDEYIGNELFILDSTTREICPHCEGLGILRK
ncbi:MAG: hypothetical protein AABY22_04610 [Nanoarchaeota archaeon]